MKRLKTAATFAMSLMLFVLLLPASSLAADASPGVKALISSFHAALKRGDGKAALALLAEDAVIFESGYAETKSEYTAHHLAGDTEFAKTTTRVVKATTSRCSQASCLVTEQTETSGTYKDKPVKSFGVETTVLEQKDGDWKIVHVHWSSHK